MWFLVGIPSHPPHLRSVTYSLLLGVLGKRKSDWEREQKDGRAKYAQFMETLLKEVENAPVRLEAFPAYEKNRLIGVFLVL